MITLKLVWSTIKRYSAFLFFAAGVIFAYVITRKRGPALLPPMKDIKSELAAVRAVGDAEKKIAEKGFVLAKKEVEDAYERDKAQFTADEQRAAEVLRTDPVALSRFLARTSARKRL